MAEQSASISITAKRKIFKYAEGVEPVEGNEYEVVETEVLITGKEAEELLKQMEGVIDGSN